MPDPDSCKDELVPVTCRYQVSPDSCISTENSNEGGGCGLAARIFAAKFVSTE